MKVGRAGRVTRVIKFQRHSSDGKVYEHPQRKIHFIIYLLYSPRIDNVTQFINREEIPKTVDLKYA